eukprot:TRINITY_DN22963_c0_g1_i1.p1 TRINITY_DN22963_c0_g1~~TRINITY_DN22963_c0_g1_i1.p1  ORF type:complete len:430 (+),score=65.94 TRINITY_DN22963_c0_g1_i1:134-1423(+)
MERPLDISSPVMRTKRRSLGSITRTMKIALAGDGTVGKTAMLMNYVMQGFLEEYVPTMFDQMSTIEEVDNEVINVTLWDTAGQEDYETVRHTTCFPNTNVFVLVFSVVHPDSFENVKLKWYEELRRSAPQTPIILVGNKTDLRNDPAQIAKLRAKDQTPISTKQGTKRAKEIKAKAYIECSARDTKSVSDVFKQAIRVVMDPIREEKKLTAKLAKKEDAEEEKLARKIEKARRKQEEQELKQKSKEAKFKDTKGKASSLDKPATPIKGDRPGDSVRSVGSESVSNSEHSSSMPVTLPPNLSPLLAQRATLDQAAPPSSPALGSARLPPEAPTTAGALSELVPETAASVSDFGAKWPLTALSASDCPDSNPGSASPSPGIASGYPDTASEHLALASGSSFGLADSLELSLTEAHKRTDDASAVFAISSAR